MKIFQFLLFSLSFCFLSFGVQAQQSETRTPGNFTQIQSGGSWDVVVQTGNKDGVRLESKNIPLSKVITEVSNGTLKVYLEKGNHRQIGLTVYVTVKNIEGLYSSGSGNMHVKSDITSGSLSLKNSGSGNISLQKITADYLKAVMSGSGRINATGGSVGEVSLSQSGSGDFRAEKMSADAISVRKSGSGQSHFGRVERLEVKASGSGNVYYTGNPEIASISTSGSSKVVKR
ncbi:head GIN domain-containing protein [Lunatibacter salilacus]|uniref:head GIN domain-containing protein n=1 Tax=Lunatibacter salilacus TaxID=2483804 RepID=UPI00131EC885|nr:head GIN domain-containing protein [Lunatibacter salilacus]